MEDLARNRILGLCSSSKVAQTRRLGIVNDVSPVPWLDIDVNKLRTWADDSSVTGSGDFHTKDSTGTSSGSDTTHTKPASLVADAVTVLSNGWTDCILQLSRSSISARWRWPEFRKWARRVFALKTIE